VGEGAAVGALSKVGGGESSLVGVAVAVCSGGDVGLGSGVCVSEPGAGGGTAPENATA
jgi:hypothetical protein